MNDPIVLLIPSLASLFPLLLIDIPLKFVCKVILGDRWPNFIREFFEQAQLHLEGSVHTNLLTLVLHPVREGMSAT